MADNLTAPAAGSILAADDVSSVFYPRVKISWGVDGSAVDASATNPFPVVLASVPLPTGASTETTLSAFSAKVPASLGAKAGTGSFSIVPATDASFAVTGTFWQATQPVSGTFWQATQPISAASLPLPTGAATEATLSAMSGKLPSTLGIKTAANSFSIAPASDATFALAATETYVGKTGGDVYSVTATPTVSSSPAYSTGDVIGAKMTFASMIRVAAGSGIVQGATLYCKSNQTAAIDLLLFSADPSSSTFTDNGALALNAADYDKLIGVIHITDWTSLGTPSIAQSQNVGIPFKLASGTTIYGVLVSRGTPTLGSTSDLKLALNVIPG